MTQTTIPEVIFGSQYFVTLGHNHHETSIVDQEISELVDLLRRSESAMNIIKGKNKRVKTLKDNKTLEK